NSCSQIGSVGYISATCCGVSVALAVGQAKFRKRPCPLYPRKRTCAVQQLMSALGQRRPWSPPMSALGQKPTFAMQYVISALPPTTDMCIALAHVCFGPKADMRPHELCECYLTHYVSAEAAPLRSASRSLTETSRYSYARSTISSSDPVIANKTLALAANSSRVGN